MRDGELSIGIGLRPELIRLKPFLKIMRAVTGLRLFFKSDPEFRGRRIGVLGIINNELAGGSACPGCLHHTGRAEYHLNPARATDY
jgi:hypothetical protein